jgi:hypothetical protein
MPIATTALTRAGASSAKHSAHIAPSDVPTSGTRSRSSALRTDVSCATACSRSGRPVYENGSLSPNPGRSIAMHLRSLSCASTGAQVPPDIPLPWMKTIGSPVPHSRTPTDRGGSSSLRDPTFATIP